MDPVQPSQRSTNNRNFIGTLSEEMYDEKNGFYYIEEVFLYDDEETGEDASPNTNYVVTVKDEDEGENASQTDDNVVILKDEEEGENAPPNNNYVVTMDDDDEDKVPLPNNNNVVIVKEENKGELQSFDFNFYLHFFSRLTANSINC